MILGSFPFDSAAAIHLLMIYATISFFISFFLGFLCTKQKARKKYEYQTASLKVCPFNSWHNILSLNNIRIQNETKIFFGSFKKKEKNEKKILILSAFRILLNPLSLNDKIQRQFYFFPYFSIDAIIWIFRH